MEALIRLVTVSATPSSNTPISGCPGQGPNKRQGKDQRDRAKRSDRAGDEIVQLYVRDPVANTTRPVQELKGFERITLAAGESCKVIFDLAAADLAFYDTDMKLVIEPGTIQVWLGTSSREALEGSFELVVAGKKAKR